MAALSSSQSGNWSSSSTWGGSTPADGDTFTITSGHTVTIDSGIATPTNGWGDITVYGILQSQASATMTFRLNGRLTVRGGGTFHARAGITVQVKGATGDTHGIQVDNEAGADLIIEGSDGMPSTTTTSAVAINAEYIPVSSASDFAIGEQIAIYDVTTSYSGTDWTLPIEGFQDEGFWIHDISSNNIYVRHYVSPEATITKTSGNNAVFVDNAKVFRVNQRVIFNTGSDRNFRTISAINYNRNKITFSADITNKGNQVGETIYLGGIEKAHVTASKVRKVCTLASAETSSTGTTISVLDSTMFAVGDDIFIERVSEADGTTEYQGYWSANHKHTLHTISSISGNNITVNAAIDYTVKTNARVVRLTRDVKFECLTAGTDFAHLYVEHTSSWNRACIIKDAYFKNWGNGNSNSYTGVVLRGINSHDSGNIDVTLTETIPDRTTGTWVEGLAIHIYPDNAHERDWGPLWLYDCRSAATRCCIVMHGDDGISCYYEPGYKVYHNIVHGTDSYNYRMEGMDSLWEVAYNHSSRGNYGYRVYAPYSGGGRGFHSNSADSNNYSLSLVHMSWNPMAIYKCKFTGHRYGINGDFTDAGIVYSEIKSCSGFPQPYNDATTRGTSQDGQYRQNNMYQGTGRVLKVHEMNFEIDHTRKYGYRWEAFYDNDEGAWRFFRRYDSDEHPGYLDTIYVPANTTLRYSTKIKLDPDFSGTYPYLGVVDITVSNSTTRMISGESTGDHRWTGRRITTQYTSAAETDYEEKQITYGPYEWPSTVMAGPFSNNRNGAEGFWIKEQVARLDERYHSGGAQELNIMQTGDSVKKADSFTARKTRIGGRLK